MTCSQLTAIPAISKARILYTKGSVRLLKDDIYSNNQIQLKLIQNKNQILTFEYKPVLKSAVWASSALETKVTKQVTAKAALQVDHSVGLLVVVAVSQYLLTGTCPSVCLCLPVPTAPYPQVVLGVVKEKPHFPVGMRQKHFLQRDHIRVLELS